MSGIKSIQAGTTNLETWDPLKAEGLHEIEGPARVEEAVDLDDTVGRELQPVPLIDTSTLAPAAGHVVRGELRNAPLHSRDAFAAYSTMDADAFSGPDDMRLRQLSRAAERENVSLVERLARSAEHDGIAARVYGRAKTPFSTFGKLREAPGTTLSGIKDLSGARIDVTPKAAGFVDYYRAQAIAQTTIGDAMKLKKDYIQSPNPWGYTGRIHSTAEGASGLVHEIQVGSKDLSDFIDRPLVTRGGDRISLHDATGYKGQIHGVALPKELADEYPRLMQRITEANRAGQSVGEVPELAKDIERFKIAVQESLPAKLEAAPAPKLSRAAKIGRVASRGLGVLGAAGGALEVRQGVQRIKAGGDKIEGSAEIATGSGSIVVGTAMIAGRFALGTATGGAVAVLDGAKDIYRGVRDADAEKIAIGSVKGGAGAAMLAGAATANPVLLAGGALAYGGAVVYEHRAVIAEGASAAWKWAKSKL